MTNQEVNQIYWNLPAYIRKALDLLIAEGFPTEAADLIRATCHAKHLLGHTLGRESGPWPLVEFDEAKEWADWRSAIHQCEKD